MTLQQLKISVVEILPNTEVDGQQHEWLWQREVVRQSIGRLLGIVSHQFDILTVSFFIFILF